MPCRHATPGDEAGLAGLFAALTAAGDGSFFHPHPLTGAAARSICRHQHVDGGRDEYHVMVDPDTRDIVVGYGMLRGWAEGFVVPSLGIAVHPDHRGRGIARRLMTHLHDIAAERGADRVRLRVYRDNLPAVRLYASLGYELQPHSATELLGFLTLARMASP